MLKRACAALLVALLLGAALLAYGRVGEAHPRPAPVAQERPTLPPERPTLAPDATAEPGEEDEDEDEDADDEDAGEDEAVNQEEAADEVGDEETADETDAETTDEGDVVDEVADELPKTGGESRSLALLAAFAVGLITLGGCLRRKRA